MATQFASVSLESLTDKYLQAWQDHDVDAVMALHTPDTVFTSAATGTDAIGHSAVREAVSGVFAVWPDLRFHPLHVHATAKLIVGESILEVTQAIPMPLGDIMVEPTGETVRFAIADILELDNGLVKRKSSYFDALGYMRQMSATPR